MRKPALLLPLALLLVPACGGSAPSAHAPAPAAATTAAASASAAPQAAPETLAADSPRATPAGNTFTAPTGWTLTPGTGNVVLVSPDPDLRVAIVDAGKGEASALVATAWTAFHPGMKWPLKISQPMAAREGWDERRVFQYETSPNEKMVVYAIAFRHGDTWTLMLVEGGEASFERRESQAGLLGQSLRPQGYQRESFAGKVAHNLDAAKLKTLTDFIEKARNDTGTPGVAISLVQGGKVIFAGGFGVKDAAKPDKVDADTLFIIASNTKALTTLMLAKLVDEKRFAWDSHVTDVYPGFKLGDAGVTQAVEMKHLICACTGMPRQDLEWIFQFKGATPQSEMSLLGTMVPTTKFGEVFQYSNLMAGAAGFIGGHVAFPDKELGAGYDEAMRTRVFAPLGMTRTTFDFDRALAGDHASAYGIDIDGAVGPAKFVINRAVVPVRPAGGAWSSVNDLTRYVQMELARGVLPDGTRMVSEENLLARRAPQVEIGEDRTYGMGLMVSKRYGIDVVDHGGDLVGYHSDMFWIPEAGVGGVILTNNDRGVMLRRPFVRRVLELLYDGRAEAEDDLAHGLDAEKQGIAKERQRITVPADAAIVAKLAAKYHNDALGDVTVKGNVLDVGEWGSTFGTRKNDDGTISLVTLDASIADFQFVVGEAGGKRTLVMRDAQHEYVFVEA